MIIGGFAKNNIIVIVLPQSTGQRCLLVLYGLGDNVDYPFGSHLIKAEAMTVSVSIAAFELAGYAVLIGLALNQINIADLF